MGRSQETFSKKEVRNKKEKKEKRKKKRGKPEKEDNKGSSLDDMIAYVDENGNITDTPPDPDKKTEINPEDIEVSVPSGVEEELDPIRKGTVNFFNDAKGFGFINDSETKESVFVHVNNTLEPIKEGNLVSFEVEMGPKGPVAVQVKLIR